MSHLRLVHTNGVSMVSKRTQREIISKKSLKISKIVLNLLLWLFGALIPLLYTTYQEIYKKSIEYKDDYYYALDATDYSLIKEYAYKDMRRSVPGLSFTSPDDKFVMPRF
jgi:hypothetical protein